MAVTIEINRFRRVRVDVKIQLSAGSLPQELALIPGDLIPENYGRAGREVTLIDPRRILTGNGKLKLNLDNDSITVNGESSFTDAGELYDALVGELVFQSMTEEALDFFESAIPPAS